MANVELSKASRIVNNNANKNNMALAILARPTVQTTAAMQLLVKCIRWQPDRQEDGKEDAYGYAYADGNA